MKRLLLPSVFAALLLGGCGDDANTVPKHSAEEDRVMKEAETLPPQQQIERIQKGAMPEGAKAAMIADIKRKHGIK